MEIIFKECRNESKGEIFTCVVRKKIFQMSLSTLTVAPFFIRSCGVHVKQHKFCFHQSISILAPSVCAANTHLKHVDSDVLLTRSDN